MFAKQLFCSAKTGSCHVRTMSQIWFIQLMCDSVFLVWETYYRLIVLSMLHLELYMQLGHILGEDRSIDIVSFFNCRFWESLNKRRRLVCCKCNRQPQLAVERKRWSHWHTPWLWSHCRKHTGFYKSAWERRFIAWGSIEFIGMPCIV